MSEQNYQCSITANVSAKEAMDKISQVNLWWVANIEGSSKELNDIFTVRFSGDTFVTFKITEYVPDKKVVWYVTDCYLSWLKDKTEWNNTKVDWEISTDNNSTTINMTHIGLTPEVECYDGCVKGWNQYVKDSLLKLLTTGEGLPQKG